MARMTLLGMTLGEAFAAGFNITALLVPAAPPGAPPRGAAGLHPFERQEFDFHSGGIVPGPRGKEVAATLLGGERVLPIGETNMSRDVTINLSGNLTAQGSLQEEITLALLMAGVSEQAEFAGIADLRG